MEVNKYHQLVSVVVPSYNYAHFLPQTLESIRGQLYTNWECIIVDDGSTDNTNEIVNGYCKQDSRFVYIYQKNSGLSAARNTGIAAAKGKYIQLLDADDLIAPEKFKNQLQCFDSDPDLDIIYSNYQLMDAEAQKFWSVDDTNWIMMKHEPFIEFLCYWEKGFTIPIHCFLFKNSCFLQWGNFDELLPTHEDLALQLNFSLNGARYRMLDEKNVFYRVHLTSMTRDYTNMHKGFLLALIKVLSNPKLKMKQAVLVVHRYSQEYLNTLLDSLRGRKNNFLKSINNKGSLVLNSFASIFLPVYFIAKIINKIVR